MHPPGHVTASFGAGSVQQELHIAWNTFSVPDCSRARQAACGEPPMVSEVQGALMRRVLHPIELCLSGITRKLVAYSLLIASGSQADPMWTA